MQVVAISQSEVNASRRQLMLHPGFRQPLENETGFSRRYTHDWVRFANSGQRKVESFSLNWLCFTKSPLSAVGLTAFTNPDGLNRIVALLVEGEAPSSNA